MTTPLNPASRRPLVAPLAAGLLVSAAIFAQGCTGYHSYPPIKGSMASTNPNSPPVDELMIVSLDWVTTRYPVGGTVISGQTPEFAINLPRGVRKSVYEYVAEKVSDRARPLTPENAETLPVYHIAELWVRDGLAKVTVLRPAYELGPAPNGKPVYQGITLRIEGGLHPWRVTRHQVWEVGTIQLPELYFCPGSEPEPQPPEPPADAAYEPVKDPEPPAPSAVAPESN